MTLPFPLPLPLLPSQVSDDVLPPDVKQGLAAEAGADQEVLPPGGPLPPLLAAGGGGTAVEQGAVQGKEREGQEGEQLEQLERPQRPQPPPSQQQQQGDQGAAGAGSKGGDDAPQLLPGPQWGQKRRFAPRNLAKLLERRGLMLTKSAARWAVLRRAGARSTACGGAALPALPAQPPPATLTSPH